MTSALLRRRGLTLCAYDGLAELEIEALPANKAIRCTLTKERSDRNLRHYWACLTAFSKATDVAAKDALHEMLKVDCGLVTPIRRASGEIVFVPASIAIEKMKETEFTAFKRKAFQSLRDNFGVDPETLTREGDAILGAQP